MRQPSTNGLRGSRARSSLSRMSATLDEARQSLIADPQSPDRFLAVKHHADRVAEADPRAAFRAYQVLLQIAPLDSSVRAEVFRLARMLTEKEPLPTNVTLGDMLEGKPWLTPWDELARTIALIPSPHADPGTNVYARYLEIAKMWVFAGHPEEAKKTLDAARDGIAGLIRSEQEFLDQVTEHYRSTGNSDDARTFELEQEAKLNALRDLARQVEEFEFDGGVAT